MDEPDIFLVLFPGVLWFLLWWWLLLPTLSPPERIEEPPDDPDDVLSCLWTSVFAAVATADAVDDVTGTSRDVVPPEEDDSRRGNTSRMMSHSYNRHTGDRLQPAIDGGPGHTTNPDNCSMTAMTAGDASIFKLLSVVC